MKTKFAADGRRYTESGKQVPLTLDEAMGYRDESSPYKITDSEEYSKYLNSLNLIDLQSHAIKIGVKPNVDRARLIYRLKEEHRKGLSSYLGVVASQPDNTSKESREVIRRIMAV